jgi:hypothetical protein
MYKGGLMKKVLYIAIASIIAFHAGQASASDQKDKSDCKMKFTKEDKRFQKTNRIAKAGPRDTVRQAIGRGKVQ